MSAGSTDHSGGRRRTLYGTTHLPGHPVGPPRSAVTPLQQPLPGEHAVVLGASMGGLLAAKVLADFYDTVTVVERDVLVAALGKPAPVSGALGYVDDTSGQFDGPVDVSEPGLLPCDMDVGNRRDRQRKPPVEGCFAVFVSRSKPASRSGPSRWTSVIARAVRAVSSAKSSPDRSASAIVSARTNKRSSGYAKISNRSASTPTPKLRPPHWSAASGQVVVGTQHCNCMRTHRTHSCRVCGHTTYTPTLGSACRRHEFDER
jgi:pimeloyl-ACP methyl ester carboxylesterase